MKLIKQLNEKRILDTRPDSKFKYLDINSVKGINDVFEAEEHPCELYMDPERIADFSQAIADLMEDGSTYEDAKNKAFDETEVPPEAGECDKMLKDNVELLLDKTIK